MMILIDILAIWFALNIALALAMYFKPLPAHWRMDVAGEGTSA